MNEKRTVESHLMWDVLDGEASRSHARSSACTSAPHLAANSVTLISGGAMPCWSTLS